MGVRATRGNALGVGLDWLLGSTESEVVSWDRLENVSVHFPTHHVTALTVVIAGPVQQVGHISIETNVIALAFVIWS